MEMAEEQPAEGTGIEALGENEYADRNLLLLHQLGMLPAVSTPKKQKKKPSKMPEDPSALRRTARAVKQDSLNEKALEKRSMKCVRCQKIGHTLANCPVRHLTKWGKPTRSSTRARGQVRYNADDDLSEGAFNDDGREIVSDDYIDRPQKRRRGRPPAFRPVDRLPPELAALLLSKKPENENDDVDDDGDGDGDDDDDGGDGALGDGDDNAT